MKSCDYTAYPNTNCGLAGNSQAGSTWSPRMSQVGVWANGYLKHLFGTIRASLVIITQCLFQSLPQIEAFLFYMCYMGFGAERKGQG